MNSSERQTGLPDSALICDIIASETGLRVEASALEFEWREWRWMAVGAEVVVLVAGSYSAWPRLEREASLMSAVRRTAGASIPEILVADPEARLQVREAKSGLHGHEIEAQIFGLPSGAQMEAAPRFAPDCPLTPWGEAFALDLGRTLARFHRAMDAAQGSAVGFVPFRVNWDSIERRLHELDGVDHLRRALPAARAWDESIRVEEVVLHGDPHLYNMFAATDGKLSGLIDFGDAVIGCRREDLRYVHSEGPRFASIAMWAYQEESGVKIDPEDVARYHVRSALDHFAWWDLMVQQGRQRKIIEWATAALSTLTPEWAS